MASKREVKRAKWLDRCVDYSIDNSMLILPLIAMLKCSRCDNNETAAALFWLSFVLLYMWREKNYHG